MKARVLANDIEPVGPIYIVGGNEVRFRRHDEKIQKIRMRGVQRLTIHNQELFLASDVPDGPKNMIKLMLLH